MSRINSTLAKQSNFALGAVLIAATVLVVAFVFSGGVQRLLAPSGSTVRAVFKNTGLLAKGMPVRVDGVAAGQVNGITLNPGGTSATVQMTMYSAVLPLYRNATAQLRFRNALGGNYALDVTRGTRSAGALPSQTITLAHTTEQVEVDQVLASLKQAQRAGLQTMVREFPHALGDAAAPGQALRTVAQASPSLRAALGDLQGQQPGDLSRLVHNTANVVQTLGADSRPLTDLVGAAATTLDTIARHQRDIQSTLDQAAHVLPPVMVTLARLNQTLGKADPVVATLRRSEAGIAPTLAALRPTVTQTDLLLHDAVPLLHALRPTATNLSVASRVGLPVLDAVTPSLGRINNSILPDLAKPDPGTHRATYEMIGSTLAGLDSASAPVDGVSHMVGLGLGGGEHAVDTAPCQTYFTDPTSAQVLRCETIAQELGLIFGYNPLSSVPPPLLGSAK